MAIVLYGHIIENAYGVLETEFMAAAQALVTREFIPGRDSQKAREVIWKHVGRLLYLDHNVMVALIKSKRDFGRSREGGRRVELMQGNKQK